MGLDRALAGAVWPVLLTSALLTSGCDIGADAGPTQTASKQIDIGNAESTRAEIHMNSGELHLSGGASMLLDAAFRFSQQLGEPEVHYQVTGGHGVLTLDSPKNNTTFRNKVNEWTLRMGSKTPLDLNVNLGAGSVAAEVEGGAGEAIITLPRDMGAVVDAKVGIGDLTLKIPQ